jgi:hypothetical protein
VRILGHADVRVESLDGVTETQRSELPHRI